jgi:hypothetical protein
MKLKVPFKFGPVIMEKELDFAFKIATLELASLDVLKCDLSDMTDKEPTELTTAIIYSAYVQSCKDRFKKPYYKYSHAVTWVQHMSKETQQELIKAIQDMQGKMRGQGTEDKKKSDMGRPEVIRAGGAGMDFAEVQRCDYQRV